MGSETSRAIYIYANTKLFKLYNMRNAKCVTKIQRMLQNAQ